MEEIWKDIQDYEGLYQVSNYGRVKSLERDVETQRGVWHCYEKLLKWHDNGKGHMYTILSKDSKVERKLIHRLVAEAFIPNPNNYDVVHHKDHNKQNNHVSNLEWMSDAKHKAHHSAKTVYQYTKDGLLVNVWKTALEAEKVLGIDSSSVCLCCNGKRKTHSGYIWSYTPLA